MHANMYYTRTNTLKIKFKEMYAKLHVSHMEILPSLHENIISKGMYIKVCKNTSSLLVPW